jgi:adenosylcobinamide-GDP ribazoletransferase
VNALRLAFGLLTAVPVGRLPEVSRRSAGSAILLAPLTTLPVLAVLACAHLLVVGAGAPALVVAALVLLCEALVTRAMHLDGLADTVDGLSAGYDAESSLRAMKASDVGPSGVAAVVLALLLQAACLAALLPTTGGAVLAGLAWLASRQVLSWACRRGVPAAQRSGLGAMVAGTVPPLAAAGGSFALLVVGTVAVALSGTNVWSAAVWSAAVMVAGVLATLALVRRVIRRLGGVSGDVLGAVVEVALCAGLLVAALLR